MLIDDVQIVQSPTITNTSDGWCADSSAAQMTVALDEGNLGVTPAGNPLRFAVHVSSTAQPTLQMSNWKLRELSYNIRSPLGDVLSSDTLGPHDLDEGGSFRVRLGKGVRGAMLFEYNASASVASSEVRDSGAYRLLVGTPVSRKITAAAPWRSSPIIAAARISRTGPRPAAGGLRRSLPVLWDAAVRDSSAVDGRRPAALAFQAAGSAGRQHAASLHWL